MSETEKTVEFGLPFDWLCALVNQGIREPQLPKTRTYNLSSPEPGDEQKCEEIEDIFTPEEFEAAGAAAVSLIDQTRYSQYPQTPPIEQRDYNDSFPARPEDSFTFYVPREAIPGIRKCLELAVASHGPRGWMGRCLLHLEAKFAALGGLHNV